MALRDAIAALPPDAIAQVVQAWRVEWEKPSGSFATAAVAFREALAAVLPQEAGALPTENAHAPGYRASRAPSEAALREPSEAAIYAAAKTMYEWEKSPYLGRFVFDELEPVYKQTRLYDARLMLEAAYAIDGLSGSPVFREAPPDDTDFAIVRTLLWRDPENNAKGVSASGALAHSALTRILARAASRPEGDGAV